MKGERKVMSKVQVSIVLIVSVVSFVYLIIGYIINIKGYNDEDEKANTEDNIKLDDVCSLTDKTGEDIKDIDCKMRSVTKTQILQRQDIKDIYRKLDSHNDRIKEHEDKLNSFEKDL